jgi:hypothetical protein
MVSYQWADSDAAELIHEELSLRGLTVFHDRCSFPAGSRIGQTMEDAVAICDGFVAYLTPNSLYELAPAGVARPALDAEFKPAMDRAERSRADGGALRRPVVIPLAHGLGDPRTEAPARVWAASGKDISSLWTPVTIDQSNPAITQAEAAAVADELIGALLCRGEGSQAGPIEMAVTSRGTGQPAAFLSVDATSLVGGTENRPGAMVDWERYLAGLQSLQRALAAWTTGRELSLRVRTHLTGAIALGRIFHQAGGWHPTVRGRHGDVAPTDSGVHPDLRVAFDKGFSGGALSIDLDLLGVKMGDLSSKALSTIAMPVTSRLAIWRDPSQGDLGPEDIAKMAQCTADAFRDAVYSVRPAQVHVFCAAPVEFGVLLGHRLTSMHTDIHLYERDAARYVPSLVIPAAA